MRMKICGLLDDTPVVLITHLLLNVNATVLFDMYGTVIIKMRCWLPRVNLWQNQGTYKMSSSGLESMKLSWNLKMQFSAMEISQYVRKCGKLMGMLSYVQAE